MTTTPGPDFLFIGAPETATSVLLDALAQHPQVHDATGAPFENGQLRGDDAPFTLWSRSAQEELATQRPDVRLISVVRDPVDRAFASWTRLRAEGREPEADFVKAVQLEDERIAAGWEPEWRYRALGRYGEQFTHLFQLIEPRQNLILRHRDVLDHPELSLNRVCELLGIDTGLVETEVGTAHHLRPRPTAEQRTALLPLFADDIERFARLVGQEFGEWLEDRTAASLPA